MITYLKYKSSAVFLKVKISTLQTPGDSTGLERPDGFTHDTTGKFGVTGPKRPGDIRVYDTNSRHSRKSIPH